jgi:hypothetical protein
MREEIWAGLKNAIERGDDVEKAISSFINAGYNPSEVREAARALTQGVSAMVAENKPLEEDTPKKEQIKPKVENDERPLSASSTALPKITIKNNDLVEGEASVEELKKKLDMDKAYYIPGSEKIGQSQNYPSRLQFRNIDYIPGTNSYRVKRTKFIILSIIILIFLTTVLLAFLNWEELVNLVKEFYG